MSKTRTSFCFTENGLLNPEAIDFMNTHETKEIALFTDGTVSARLHRLDFCNTFYSPKFVERIINVGVPKYELRVIGEGGQVSRPHYAYTDEVAMKWMCAKVAAPHISLYVSAKRPGIDPSKPRPSIKVDRKMAETICYLANKLWQVFLVLENETTFPAVLFEKLVGYTYYLTEKTMEIDTLNHLVGTERMEYHAPTKTLSVQISGSTHAIDIRRLNTIYGEFVLPLYRDLQGRRLEWSYSEFGNLGTATPISIGMLGRMVEECWHKCVKKTISNRKPIAPDDLLAFSKKAELNDENSTVIYLTTPEGIVIR